MSILNNIKNFIYKNLFIILVVFGFYLLIFIGGLMTRNFI